MGKGGSAYQKHNAFSSVNFDTARMRSNSDDASLFDQFRVSLFMKFWFISSVASLFIAKHVLHIYHLNEAVFSLWQFAISVLFGLLFTKLLRLQTLSTLTNSQFRSIVPLSATFLVKEVLKYAALSRVSVNLVNTIRSLGPLFNVILELIWLGHRPPPPVLWALVPIVVGVALTSIDEIHVASTSDSRVVAVVGFLAAILSTAINNGQNIYSKILFGRERIDPVSLQIYLSAISFALMSPFTFMQLTYESFREGRLSHEMLLPSRPVIAGLVFAGFVNFVASQLAFNTLRLVSPLSYSVANIFKRVAIAVVAIFYFNERMSIINGIGIFMSIVGIFIYERQSRSLKEAHQYRSLPNNESTHLNQYPTGKQNASGPDLISLTMPQDMRPFCLPPRCNK